MTKKTVSGPTQVHGTGLEKMPNDNAQRFARVKHAAECGPCGRSFVTSYKEAVASNAR